MTGFDIVIIGAGIQGLSAAYQLAKRGARSVAVVEALAKPGQGSSRRSGSMLMKSRENRAKISLSLYSYERLMNFKAEFGKPLHFRKTGFLSVVREMLADRYLSEHNLRLEMGVASEILSPREIKRISPGVVVDDLSFGILGPDDGEIDAVQLLDAYEKASVDRGVKMLVGTQVTGITTQGGAVVSVQTTAGDIACDWVVDAAGPRARLVASWIGLNLPIKNLSRSLYYLHSADPSFQDGPMVEDAEREWYFRALGGGVVMMGMGLEDSEMVNDEINEILLPDVMSVAGQRAPALSCLRPVAGSTAVRALTPDILPIVGPTRVVDGFIASCGWGGEGIMHAPAGGCIVADWILDQKEYPPDARDFLPDRF
jgi:sarcosine oxidase subunit beta